MPRAGEPFYNMPRAEGVPPRWTATIWYRSDDGLFDVVHEVEELDMLHEIVERGPDFYAIDHIRIELARNDTPNLTIEAARQR